MGNSRHSTWIGTSTLAITALVTGCGSMVEGVFEPACIAYEGDRISLAGGRFEWDRFTDAVPIDIDGNAMDPFPEYPKSGRVLVDGAKLLLNADDGTSIAERFLLDYRGQTYLLTYDQNEAVLDGEDMPACALVLVNGTR